MNSINKKILSLFLSLVLILGVIIGAAPMVAFAETESSTLTIVHVNDVHGQVKGNDSVIGYEKLKTIVNDLKEENPNVLLLNAGDTLHGTTLATLSSGEAIVKLMNKMEFDAITPGNHEFNYGYDRLVELANMAEFSFLGANILKEDDTSDFEPYIIKEFDGFKVGIFGISTQETKVKSHPNNTKGIKFEDPVATSEKIVKELEDKVDVIVGLFHVGIDEESEITSIDIAEKVDGIDILVDGHSHSTLPEGKLVNDTLIVQAHEWTKNIGVVELTIEDGNIVYKEAKLIKHEDTVETELDPEIVAEIEKIEANNKEILREVVGKTTVPLVGEREVVRAGESNLGNLITDVMLEISGADVAITNGGGIRASIDEGEITLEDILTTFPFTNYPVVIEVTGQTIVDALNYGVDAYPEAAGKFPHVAGMTFKIKTNDEANSVGEVRIKGEPIDLDAKYKLVTNDFMGAGGDGYTMFEGATILAEYGLLSEVLADYIRAEGEIEPKVEGRITEVEKEVEAEVKKYIVKPGDVLWKIGKMFEKTYQELAEFNNIKNPHLIYPAQEILIPY
ncbi:MAG: 5'-nucleotidase C-terminal domain-containing protein [Tissierellaceae bacterium]|nr:5'-nucleotidase C-terminal domain-containing protein [Tissierellaceae bacterium]